MIPRRPRASERGSVTVELVIVAPLIGALIAVVVVVGRVGAARADVESAARSAARTISLTRDPADAVAEARTAAARSLSPGSPTCRAMSFEPTITAQTVAVRITCSVDLRDGTALPLPGSLTISGDALEVIDQHRERGP